MRRVLLESGGSRVPGKPAPQAKEPDPEPYLKPEVKERSHYCCLEVKRVLLEPGGGRVRGKPAPPATQPGMSTLSTAR